MSQATDLFSRAELFSLLQISDRAITKGLVQIDEAGLFSLSGKILANGKPEKLYKFSDLPKKWQKRLTSPQTPLQNGEGLKSGDEIARNERNETVAGSEKSPEFKAVESGTPNDANTDKPIEKVQEQSKEQKNFQGAAFGSSVTGLPAGIGEAVSITVKMGGTVKENVMISAVMDIENRKGSVKEAVEAVMRT